MRSNAATVQHINSGESEVPVIRCEIYWPTPLSTNTCLNAPPPAMINTIMAMAPIESPMISIICSIVRPLRRPRVKMARTMAINKATAGLPINSKNTRTLLVFGSVISHTAATAISMTGITAAKILFQNDGISSSVNK
ncbi:hypothetical protein D3C73_1137620 [compost metagenome]